MKLLFSPDHQLMWLRIEFLGMEVRPSYMSNADYSSINFSIIGNSSQYVKLSDTELYVRINIENEDGTPFTTTND